MSTFAGDPIQSGSEHQAPHVSIVLPCYNEEEHVLLEVERICAAMDKSGISYELLAIDDGSTDQTLARLRRAEPDFPRLKVIPFRRNGGAGTVRRIGSQQAIGTDLRSSCADPERQVGDRLTLHGYVAQKIAAAAGRLQDTRFHESVTAALANARQRSTCV